VTVLLSPTPSTVGAAIAPISRDVNPGALTSIANPTATGTNESPVVTARSTAAVCPLSSWPAAELSPTVATSQPWRPPTTLNPAAAFWLASPNEPLMSTMPSDPLSWLQKKLFTGLFAADSGTNGPASDSAIWNPSPVRSASP